MAGRIITRGFGAAVGVAYVPTRGFAAGEAEVITGTRALTLLERSAALTLETRARGLTLQRRRTSLTVSDE